MNRNKVKTMVGVSILIAIVVVLQLLGQFIKFGPVSISLVLMPIVVGAAMFGPGAGAILGLAFSVVVLLQPDTAFFYGMSVYGTVVTVLVKGTLCGWLAGLIYQTFSKLNTYLGVILAAVICPIVNTGIFYIGCMLFFYEPLGAAFNVANVGTFVITAFIGINFLAEFIVNVLCCPVIMRLLHAIKK